MKLFGTHSERYLRSIRKDMDRIEALAGEMSARSDEELKALSGSLKKRAMAGEDVLPEAFALVREAARRTIGLYPYKVQLQAARALYDGKISTGAEAAECLADLKKRIESVGYETVSARGDCKS